MKWLAVSLCVFIGSMFNILCVSSSQEPQEPQEPQNLCWDLIPGNACSFYGNFGNTTLCDSCHPVTHVCTHTMSITYNVDEDDWNMERWIAEASPVGLFGLATGQEILCFTTDTCQRDCQPIVGGVRVYRGKLIF